MRERRIIKSTSCSTCSDPAPTGCQWSVPLECISRRTSLVFRISKNTCTPKSSGKVKEKAWDPFFNKRRDQIPFLPFSTYQCLPSCTAGWLTEICFPTLEPRSWCPIEEEAVPRPLSMSRGYWTRVRDAQAVFLFILCTPVNPLHRHSLDPIAQVQTIF